jgi:hypothetical protein
MTSMGMSPSQLARTAIVNATTGKAKITASVRPDGSDRVHRPSGPIDAGGTSLGTGGTVTSGLPRLDAMVASMPKATRLTSDRNPWQT